MVRHLRYQLMDLYSACHQDPAPVLVLFCSQGISIVCYFEGLLLREQSAKDLEDNVSLTLQLLQRFRWILNLQKLSVVPTHQLEYLGLVLDTYWTRVFLSQEKLQAL